MNVAHPNLLHVGSLSATNCNKLRAEGWSGRRWGSNTTTNLLHSVAPSEKNCNKFRCWVGVSAR